MNKSFIYKFTVMKKILFSLFMLSLLSTSVIAQQPIQKSGDNNRNKEMHNTPKPDIKKDNKKCCMSVAETTKLQTEQLKTLLQLSDEQTRKVHAILLRGNQNDSIMNIQVEKMRKDQMAQHTAQAEAIKKLIVNLLREKSKIKNNFSFIISHVIFQKAARCSELLFYNIK